MNNDSIKQKIPSLENIFDDFLHPNPNINTQACLDMIRYWPEVSMPRLISNLKEPDIVLRRKSIKALGYFGDIALEPVVNYFFDNSELIARVSCLKVLIKIVTLEKYPLMPIGLREVVNLCLRNEEPQIILAIVCLLKQLGKTGLPILIEASKNNNILLSKASVTAICEINDPAARECLRGLLEDESTDKLVRESIVYNCSNHGAYEHLFD